MQETGGISLLYSQIQNRLPSNEKLLCYIFAEKFILLHSMLVIK